MSGWYLRSQIAVALHEDCHALADCGEQYHHTDGTIYCTGKAWSVMDCGLGHALFIQPFDLSLFANFNYPQWHHGGRLVGNTLYYGGSDARTTRVAVFFETYAGYRYFSGRYLTPAVGCSAIVCGAATVDPGFCMGVWLGHENALPGSWLRNLEPAGWTNCY